MFLNILGFLAFQCPLLPVNLVDEEERDLKNYSSQELGPIRHVAAAETKKAE